MGQLFGLVAFWVADVVLLSLVLALVEIVLEKDRGWASALNSGLLGKKLLAGSPVVQWIDKPYVTSYHLLVFGGLLPLALWTQCRMGMMAGFRFAAGTSAVAEGLFFVAAFLGICILEDFLWFALNWYYPRSLPDLLAGEIWWHTRWVRLGAKVKLPRCYLSVGGAAVGLLAVSLFLAFSY